MGDSDYLIQCQIFDFMEKIDNDIVNITKFDIMYNMLKITAYRMGCRDKHLNLKKNADDYGVKHNLIPNYTAYYDAIEKDEKIIWASNIIDRLSTILQNLN